MTPALPPRVSRLIVLLGLAALAPASGQGSPANAPTPETLARYTYRVQGRSVAEAIERIRPLLSRRGTIEVDAEGSTLVVHDSLAALTRVAQALATNSSPAVAAGLRVQLVWAGQEGRAPPNFGVSPPPTLPMPADLAQRLRHLLRFDAYTLLSEARLEARAGDQVSYDFNTGYRVEFELGRVGSAGVLPLYRFRVVRAASDAAGEKELLHTSVNLPLVKPLILGLTRDEASNEALLIVLSYEAVGGN